MKGPSIAASAWYATEEEDDVYVATGMLVADGTFELMDRVALDAGDDVAENVAALAEGCRLFEGLPARLNNLGRVSVGCITVASELVAIGTLLALECSDTAAVDVKVGRVADAERNWFNGPT